MVPLDLDGVLLLLLAVLLLLLEEVLRFTVLFLFFGEVLRFTVFPLLLEEDTLELVDLRVVVCLFTEPLLLLEERLVTVLVDLDLETVPLLDDPTLLERLISFEVFPL